ncbi:sulfite exporter TauE/SafE family protein [Algibacillus agarilyticus]|uniref:sulfite exporter TauE/SafE family protein n=1 Tax=Algibacillus agarilyticus TaxID=2234133 RepID=UPI000DD04589|nr:sulfite exporter TauE/SafE family protein [Algibacillus agarilyticus]
MTDIPLTIILIANSIVFTGALIQGVMGYGIGMFCAPLLFILYPQFVPAPMIIVASVLTTIMLFRDKSFINYAQVKWTMLGGLLGTVIAGLILSSISLQEFQLIFGGLILVAVGFSIFGFSVKLNRINCTIAGGLSGFMGIITAVGGPPVALLYQRCSLQVLRANISAFFMSLNIIILITLYVIDRLTWNDLQLVMFVIPGIILGFIVSNFVAPFLSPLVLRWFILTFSAIGGLVSIGKALV